MPRFVLLRHDCPPDYERPSHWDLMLESDGVLRTWALAKLPRASNDSVDAEKLADHRLAYLDYEGPVSGERGTVSRVDAGTYETLVEANDCWEIRLNGSVLRGRLALRRTANNRWMLTVESTD